MLDVTPLTLGIETEGGVLTPIVERNTTIPVEKKQVFSTAADNQPAVTFVKVFQGERKMAANNKVLGSLTRRNLRRHPVVYLKLKSHLISIRTGILNVSAKDLGTQKEASVRIEDSAGLEDEEIERMRRDA